MSADHRESPEWTEWERRIANYHEAVNNWSVGEGTESQIDHTRAALDAFVLRLLEQVAKLGARYADARAEADRLAVRPLMPEAE